AVARPAAVPRAREAAAARPRGGYWTMRNGLLACADGVSIVGAIILSYYVRFASQLALPGAVAGIEASGDLLLRYVKSACILAAVWQYALWRGGAYQRGLRGSSAPTVRIAVLASGGACALAAVMAIGVMYRDLLLSRQVYVMGAALALAALATVREAFERLDRRRAARGDVAGRVLVVGVNESARNFADTLRRDAPWMQVMGFLAEEGADGGRGDAVVGSVRDVASLHRQLGFDTLVLASPGLAAEAMSGGRDDRVSLVNFCEERGISLYMLSGSFSVAVSPEEVGSFSGMPLIRLEDAALHPMYALVKRLADIVAALACIVIGLPLWLLVAALVKLTSPGPLFFTQLRAGQHGRPFRMYKFRSMTADAEERLGELVDLAHLATPVFKLKNDPRVTPVGRWMRRTGLDEIPQLLNVLRGEMSIVGPRPEEARLVDQYTPGQRRRLKAKPGITGYQQIRNRGGTDLAERVEYDLVYLKHQGPMLDLYILWNTPAVLVRGSGITH
ncbi:MAG TPA: sugar transferase, partial [Longimicrobiaceae bacterium]